MHIYKYMHIYINLYKKIYIYIYYMHRLRPHIPFSTFLMPYYYYRMTNKHNYNQTKFHT